MSSNVDNIGGENSWKTILRTDAIDSFSDFFQSFNENDPRVAICYSHPCTGLSWFLENIDKHFEEQDVEYLQLSKDDKSLNSSLNQLFTQLLSDNSYRVEFQRFISLYKNGFSVENIIRSLAVCIPILGPAFGVMDHNGLKNLREINNDIQILNIGFDFLEFISRKKPIVITIDLDNEIKDFPFISFLTRLSGNVFNRIKFVVGVKMEEGFSLETQKIEVKLENTGLLTKRVFFPVPSPSFVKSLYSNSKIDIDDETASEICLSTECNVYSIIKGLHAIKKSNDLGSYFFSELDHEPSAIEKKVIGFLVVAEQALPESELTDLLKLSNDIFIEDLLLVRETIDYLSGVNLISIYSHSVDRLISLKKIDSLSLVSGSNSKVDYLLISQQLYDYYSIRFDKSNGLQSLKYAPMLFRLSSICAQNLRSLYGRSVLRYSVLMQNFEDLEDKLSNSFTRSTNTDKEQLLLSVLYQVVLKNYKKALLLLNSTPDSKWRNNHPFLVLEAICSNRLRMHEKADALLHLAIQNASSIEEEVILRGYLIANYLHWDKSEKAKRHFSKYSERCKSASNYPYLLRNAAAAFDKHNKLKMELHAAKLFDKQGNIYGKYSSLANVGATKMTLKYFDQANSIFEKSLPHLEKYGIQHSAVISFNRMAIRALNGDLDSANFMAQRILRMPDHNLGLTNLYVSFYQSLIAFRMGDVKKCARIIEQLIKETNNSKLARPKQRMYSNSLILGLAIGMDKDFLKGIYNEGINFPDKRNPNITNRIYGYAKLAIEENKVPDLQKSLDLLSPPYFAYWYMDEISLLSRTWFGSY